MAINEHSESFSTLRQLDVKISVLDYKYKVIDEISGFIENANISIDADSDIRRTLTMSMVLDQGLGGSLSSYNPYNNNTKYYQGDIVRFGDKLYECINTKQFDVELIDVDGNSLTDDDGNILTILSGGGNYIIGISPNNTLFWAEYTTTSKSSLKYWKAGNPYWFDKYIKMEVGIKNQAYYQYDSVQPYDNTKEYYIGDMVKYGGRLYQCKTVESVPIDLHVQGEGNTEQVLVYDDTTQSPPTTSILQVMTSSAVYIKNIIPTNINYWDEVEEYTWVNQGVFMVNSPSLTYNATDNSLSLQAIDLMSKLTGMRSGYLEGMTYQIKAGSGVVSSIRSVLEEQGFTQMVLNKPPIATTPIDINIDIGSTAYDLLVQLRDINPNWEMFFDVNGVFRFQQIPSGQNEAPEFGDEVWERVSLGYNLDTSFEDVKNYIEVIGKQIEPDEIATVTTTPNLTLKLARPWSSYCSTDSNNNVVWYIGFNLGSLAQPPSAFATPYTQFIITDSNDESPITITIPNGKPPIYYNNEAYFVRLTFDDVGYVNGEFAGYLQPRAIAFENNPESPFYVGSAVEYICGTNSAKVEFVDEDYDGYIAEYSLVGIGGEADLNITNGLNYKEFSEAPEGQQWAFKVNATTNDVPITTINLVYGGGSNDEYMVVSGGTHENYDVLDEGVHTHYQVSESVIITLSDQPIYKDDSSFTSSNTISLDFDTSYVLIAEKIGGSIKIIGKYYPIPSSEWTTPTTQIHNIPRFTNMVRGVFSGDEYDNIYTNDLAQQRAKYELYLNCRLHDTITIDCVPLYWLDVNRLMSYVANNQSEDNRWIIKSINTDFSVGGTQSVNAMRYYALYNN